MHEKARAKCYENLQNVNSLNMRAANACACIYMHAHMHMHCICKRMHAHAYAQLRKHTHILALALHAPLYTSMRTLTSAVISEINLFLLHGRPLW